MVSKTKDPTDFATIPDAVQKGTVSDVVHLLQAGHPIEEWEESGEWNGLHASVFQHRPEHTIFLLRQGIDPDTPDRCFGWSPMRSAVETWHACFVRLLLYFKADYKTIATDKYPETPYDTANYDDERVFLDEVAEHIAVIHNMSVAGDAALEYGNFEQAFQYYQRAKEELLWQSEGDRQLIPWMEERVAKLSPFYGYPIEPFIQFYIEEAIELYSKLKLHFSELPIESQKLYWGELAELYTKLERIEEATECEAAQNNLKKQSHSWKGWFHWFKSCVPQPPQIGTEMQPLQSNGFHRPPGPVFGKEKPE